jgi:hypothetical protein
MRRTRTGRLFSCQPAELARRVNRNASSVRRLFTASQTRPELPLIIALADPLTYASEGLRAAATSQPHLSLLVVYPVMTGFAGLLLWQATRQFVRRVIS